YRCSAAARLDLARAALAANQRDPWRNLRRHHQASEGTAAAALRARMAARALPFHGTDTARPTWPLRRGCCERNTAFESGSGRVRRPRAPGKGAEHISRQQDVAVFQDKGRQLYGATGG